MKLPLLARKVRPSPGSDAENHAARHLAGRGLKIIDRNYRTPRGEIDLIARHGDLLLFIEVRLRNHRRYASGAESVDLRKQARLAAAAGAYLQKKYGDSPPPCRFDVVSLAAAPNNSGGYVIEWVQDAFRPEG